MGYDTVLYTPLNLSTTLGVWGCAHVRCDGPKEQAIPLFRMHRHLHIRALAPGRAALAGARVNPRTENKECRQPNGASEPRTHKF